MYEERRNDKKILRLLNENVSEGMELLIDEYGGAVKTICLSILTGFSQEDIEETISDIFVALWMTRDKIVVGRDSGLKSYLYGIARKTALNRRRKLMHDLEHNASNDIDEMDNQNILVAQDNIENEILKKSEYVILHQLIEEMKSPDCEIFKYRYFEDYSVKEIAKQLNLTAKVVENRLGRGRAKLKQQLILCGIDMEVR